MTPGKVLTYLLSIFSAEEASKAISKRRPESAELELSSKEPWDTLKAQLLVKITETTSPSFLDFDNYKVMYFIPRLVPKPGRQLVSANNYASLIKLLANCPNKVMPAINIIIEQKTTSKEKENVTAGPGGSTSKDGGAEKKVCISVHTKHFLVTNLNRKRRKSFFQETRTVLKMLLPCKNAGSVTTVEQDV